MSSQAKTVRLGLTILLSAYWLALFTATHIPYVPRELDLPGGDKSQHLVAYAGLAFLLALRQWYGSSPTWKRAWTVLGIVAVYGIVDELTQIPVGRTAEVLDWLADVAGAVGGLALLAGLRGALGRLTESHRDGAS
ncbi:MAG: VanZ family protein [Planctomycetia bacterium]|nr:VanZ family protein [Planctomycetia bacterium]